MPVSKQEVIFVSSRPLSDPLPSRLAGWVQITEEEGGLRLCALLLEG